MHKLQQSKSLLTKLLATENISVEYRNVETASFNVKSRTLILPLWEDMSPELYDLLGGHEVGHALFTPEEGWHDAVVNGIGPGFRTFLNVIEDARIENAIKSKYPGIRKSFSKAYRELIEKDFFGKNLKPFEEVNRKPILPTEEEINRNSRARSAKLRIAKRLGDGK